MMTNPTVGVAIIAKEQDELYQKCVRESQTQADAVATVVDETLTLSEARNTAAAQLDTDVYAFIDADAYPSFNWVNELRTGYQNGALAVGGPAIPEYRNGVRAYLIPDGWEWLVGGGPFYEDIREVRNTYGANFSMRSDVFDSLGGFDESLGLGADIPHGEETDLARRMNAEYGERMMYRPDAAVHHVVDVSEVTIRSLLRRAYDQGYTKARMGTDAEESGFVSKQLRNPHPWRLALTAAAGVGALKGAIDD